MSFPTASKAFSISHHLHAVKKILQDATPEVKVTTTSDKAELYALERDAFEVLRLIRSWRNTVAPISKIPPEILALVPDFLDWGEKDRGLITLTHVCRTWREVFVSRSSLWVDFDCEDAERTRVYLERSKSSPIKLFLCRTNDITTWSPFFQVIPHAIGRLESLSIELTPENLQAITPHLSHPAPLLERLTLYGEFAASHRLTLASTLFNGDFSTLRTLHLQFIRTKLPWRNMVNLTSFTLVHTPKETVPVERLLDFFEDAPRLCVVDLRFTIQTTGAQHERLVSLVCLKIMNIEGNSPSALLDHLVIPVGAKLTTRADLLESLVGEHLPTSLGNLKNFSNFTTIQLYLDKVFPRIIFSGPNGEVITILTSCRGDRNALVFGSLAQLDTSKTKRLKIDRSRPKSKESVYQALLPMSDLRTLTLSRCERPQVFIQALRPGMGLLRVCPKLEELVLGPNSNEEAFKIKNLAEIAAMRASGGMRLRTIRIVNGPGKARSDALELRKHVRNVEYGPGVGGL